MVISDSPEMAAFVREHHLGEVAKVDDPAAWAAAIRQVLAHPARYRADDPSTRERFPIGADSRTRNVSTAGAAQRIALRSAGTSC